MPSDYVKPMHRMPAVPITLISHAKRWKLATCQMYLWTGDTLNRDGDLDNGSSFMEYAHGISNRVRPGGRQIHPASVTIEQGEEGWSDYFALMYTTDWTAAQVTDGFNKAQGHWNLCANQATSGLSVRTQILYEYEREPMDLCHDSRNTGGAVHTDGEIWCTALWEMTWEIIAQGVNPMFHRQEPGVIPPR